MATKSLKIFFVVLTFLALSITVTAQSTESNTVINTIEEWQLAINDAESTGITYTTFPSGGEGIEIDLDDGYAQTHLFFLGDPETLRLSVNQRRGTVNYSIYNGDTFELVDSTVIVGENSGDIVVEDIPDNSFYITAEDAGGTNDPRVLSYVVETFEQDKGWFETYGGDFIVVLFILSLFLVILRD